MKLVAYLRVSTDRQAEHGLGLDVQEQTIRAWAKANRHKIAAVTRDEGVSGTKDLSDRDGLAEALGLIRDGKADAVVVYRLDRLARDLVLQEQLLAEVWRMGAEVFSTAGGESNLRDDPDDPSRKLIRQVLGAVSEYERAMVTLRLRRGRARKAEQGGFAYGSPPFGWQAVDGALVEDDKQQDTLRRLAELRKEGCWSLRQMAEILTAESRPPRRGDRWHPQTLARVIARMEAAEQEGANRVGV